MAAAVSERENPGDQDPNTPVRVAADLCNITKPDEAKPDEHEDPQDDQTPDCVGAGVFERENVGKVEKPGASCQMPARKVAGVSGNENIGGPQGLGKDDSEPGGELRKGSSHQYLVAHKLT